jgi:hypothetical protein
MKDNIGNYSNYHQLNNLFNSLYFKMVQCYLSVVRFYIEIIVKIGSNKFFTNISNISIAQFVYPFLGSVLQFYANNMDCNYNYFMGRSHGRRLLRQRLQSCHN